jgi:arylsulfatase A-like enzyme
VIDKIWQPASLIDMSKPNFLIFMADHMLADVLKPGNPCIMPNARKLMEEGVTFQQTYCPSPHCCPARTSFFTGEYPSIHGIWNNVNNPCAIGVDPDPDVPNLGEYLSELGYQLGHSGKGHLSAERTPASFGWQEFDKKHKPEGVSVPAEFIADFHKNPKRSVNTIDTGEGVLRRPGWGDVRFYGTNERFMDPSVGYFQNVLKGIEGMKKMAATGKPWCNFISVNPPHDPYSPPEKYLRMYDDVDIPLPESFSDWMKDKPRIYQRMRMQYWSQMSEEQNRECLKRFYALCTMVDDWLGMILKGLEETGQAKNTVVLFTSDHGDYAGAHGLWCKGVPAFREAYAVPAVVRWPGGAAKPGSVVNELVSLTDFLPTFVELAGGQKPGVFGRSLVPFLNGETPKDWRKALFTQLDGVELFYTQRIVFTKDWKYVYNGFDFDELYDLRNDPHELVNLANPELYEQGTPTRNGKFVPWPRMTPDLEAVREDLLKQLWEFARENDDGTVYTPYQTTAMAPIGPGILPP